MLPRIKLCHFLCTFCIQNFKTLKLCHSLCTLNLSIVLGILYFLVSVRLLLFSKGWPMILLNMLQKTCRNTNLQTFESIYSPASEARFFWDGFGCSLRIATVQPWMEPVFFGKPLVFGFLPVFLPIFQMTNSFCPDGDIGRRLASKCRSRLLLPLPFLSTSSFQHLVTC